MPGESVPTVEAANALVLPAPPPAEPAAHLFMGPNVEYAGWWRRVGAWVIDAMIIGISSNLVTAVLGSTGSVLLVVAGLLIGFGATFAYYIILNAVGNRTIGRKGPWHEGGTGRRRRSDLWPVGATFHVDNRFVGDDVSRDPVAALGRQKPDISRQDRLDGGRQGLTLAPTRITGRRRSTFIDQTRVPRRHDR